MKSSCVALAMVVLFGCAGTGATSNTNIVIIVIDTLRADHLSFYGYTKSTAPFLADLARDGVVFENAFSTSSWTAPAVASLFTSLDPIQHGVLTGRNAARKLQKRDATMTVSRIPDEIDTLPEVLKRAGYATYAVADNFNVSKDMGFAEGFDGFDSAWYRGAGEVNRLLSSWRDEITGGKKYFLYVHYIDPHAPYNKRSPWYQARQGDLEDTIARYDSEITYVDEKIRELYRLFGWDEGTLLIVTSDHGEEFLDHGGSRHGLTLHAEVVRIPLVVSFPRGQHGGKRVSEQVSLVDILPTLREYVGLPVGAHDLGVSLMAAVRGHGRDEPPGRTLFAHLVKKELPGENPPLDMRALFNSEWKLMTSAGQPSLLFDSRGDRREQSNLAATRPELVTRLESELRDFVRDSERHDPETVRIDLTSEERERLGSLGYVR